MWENRIVGYETVDAESLLAHPDNWRIHPIYQQQALEGVLDEIGWVDYVIVNRRTGYVVDGHMRVMLAISRQEPVPVGYVDLSEAEEAEVLALHDTIGSMARQSSQKLDALLATLSTQNSALDMMLDTLRASTAQMPNDQSPRIEHQQRTQPLKVGFGEYQFLITPEVFANWQKRYEGQLEAEVKQAVLALLEIEDMTNG